MEGEVLDGIGTGGERESRAGPVGDIKRCQGCGDGKQGTTAQQDAGGDATDAQTANINLRSTP